MYNDNTVYQGLAYQVCHTRGKGRWLPLDYIPMPVEDGDEFGHGFAPRGIDGTIALEQFRDLFGYHVNKVKVKEAILHKRGDEWDHYNTTQYACRKQTERRKMLARHAEYEAEKAKDDALNVIVGPYNETLAKVIEREGVAVGWWVRETGHHMWHEVTCISGTYIGAVRAERMNRAIDPWHQHPPSWDIRKTSQSYNPKRQQLVFRKDPPPYYDRAGVDSYRTGDHVLQYKNA